MQATGMLQLSLVGKDEITFQIEAPGVEGYVIGRSDDSASYIPDIDLLNLGGREMGVSRRHAVLVRYRGAVHLVDLNSVNGTFLNGERLIGEVPVPLKDGDRVSLGNLELAISRV